jgi:hypothetical protein
LKNEAKELLGLLLIHILFILALNIFEPGKQEFFVGTIQKEIADLI